MVFLMDYEVCTKCNSASLIEVGEALSPRLTSPSKKLVKKHPQNVNNNSEACVNQNATTVQEEEEVW